MRIVIQIQPWRSSFDAAQQQMANGVEADRAHQQGILDGVSYFLKSEGFHQAQHLHILPPQRRRPIAGAPVLATAVLLESGFEQTP